MPLVCNVLAEPISHPDDIRKRLVEQVTGRVRWEESVRYMGEQGVNRAFEVGSGKVLSGLMRRIDRTIETRAIGQPDDVTPALEAIAS